LERVKERFVLRQGSRKEGREGTFNAGHGGKRRGGADMTFSEKKHKGHTTGGEEGG